MTDTEKFRLRHFVEKLVQQGECVVHDGPIDLIDVAAVLDCNPRAVWFRAVGPEKAELVGNVMGTRRRARYRRARFSRCPARAPAASGCPDRSALRASPGARGRAHRRRCRSDHIARAFAAWARRRTVYLG